MNRIAGGPFLRNSISTQRDSHESGMLVAVRPHRPTFRMPSMCAGEDTGHTAARANLVEQHIPAALMRDD